jgi:hypothetical protein
MFRFHSDYQLFSLCCSMCLCHCNLERSTFGCHWPLFCCYDNSQPSPGCFAICSICSVSMATQSRTQAVFLMFVSTATPSPSFCCCFVSIATYNAPRLIAIGLWPVKNKAVSLHAMQELGGREDIAPTQSLLRI